MKLAVVEGPNYCALSLPVRRCEVARAAVIGQVVSGALLLCAGLLLGACVVHRAEVPGLLALTVGQDGGARIIDVSGRQVLLRGMNVNQLVDYYAQDPALPTVQPLSEADFADMARLGFNVVRLGMSWSRLEPSPGTFDDGYLGQIRQAVGWASRHGLYTVLDMHQDAWSKFVASPPGVVCPPGSGRRSGGMAPPPGRPCWMA
jgi:endoglycosylceramidase